jgi:molybdopterin-guanine dinucleotide biosynthesis protein MobB
MFKPIVPTLGVIGGKASGKTTAVEIIVKALTGKGLSVMTVKHVSQEKFSLDREGTDTWRHWKAGARIVSTVSDSEKAIMIKDEKTIVLEEFNSWADKVNVLIFEGFSSLVLKEEDIGKVICIRRLPEKETYLRDTRGPVISLCSPEPIGDGVLKFGSDDELLSNRVIKYVSSFPAE